MTQQLIGKRKLIRYQMPFHICCNQMAYFCVSPFMLLQITTPFKGLVTFRAGKWLLSCVSSFMYLQMNTVVESLFQYGAGKMFLACVCPSMLV